MHRALTANTDSPREKQAFKNYDEAGDGRRLQALKYLVLANMLSLESRINPFDSPETKAYENDPEISAMMQQAR